MHYQDHHFETIAISPEQPYLLRAGELIPSNGMVIRPHMHMQYEIMWFRSATGTYTIDDQIFDISDNTLIYIAPLVRHEMELVSTSEHQHFLLQYDEMLLNNMEILLGDTRSQRSAVLVLNDENAERLQMLFCWLVQSRVENGRLTDEVLRLLMRTVYEYLSRSDDSLDVIDPNNAIGKIIGLIRHIEKNKLHTLSLEAAASRCKFSKSHFARVFKKIMNMKYTDYLLSRKISHAQYLLARTDLSITEIAYACDFSDCAYFCYKFRHAVGVSPLTYRRYRKTTKQLSSQHDQRLSEPLRPDLNELIDIVDSNAVANIKKQKNKMSNWKH